MTAFSRVLLLALLYFAVLTTAVPVLEGNEAAEHDGLEARKALKTRPVPVRPKPKPRPVPRPIPTKKPVIIKKPAPVPVPPKRPTPVPTRRPVPVPVPTRKPVPVPHQPVPVPHQPVPVPHQPVPVPPKQPISTKSGTHTTTGAHPLPTTAPHGGNTTAPHGASCPLPNKPTKPRALLEYVSSFFLTKRTSSEFVGWHGTNSATADVWHRAGYLKKPWSWMDIIGQRRTGGSGADQELGAGVYVTDSMLTAEAFAGINAGQAHNSGTTAMLCAIFAHDSRVWRGSTPKAWLPSTLIGDSSNAQHHQKYEDNRVKWLRRVYPTVSPSDVVRFAPLDHSRGHPPGQMVIPSSRTHEFYASCVKANGGRVPNGAPSGDTDYNHARTAWHILDRTCV